MWFPWCPRLAPILLWGIWLIQSIMCVCHMTLQFQGVLEGLARFLTMQSSTISRECPFSQWSADECDFPDFHVLHPYFYGAYAWYIVSCACAIWLYSSMGVLEGLPRFLTMQSSIISREGPFSQWSEDKCDFSDVHVLHPYFLGHMLDTKYHVRVSYESTVPWAS